MVDLIQPEGDSLLRRVISILEQARGNVVRSINTNMVLAYWLIGREIVQELQAGEDRAEYGKQVLEKLASELKKRYGKGFSATNLKNFRLFFQAYPDRLGFGPIRHLTGDELEPAKIPYKTSAELGRTAATNTPPKLVKKPSATPSPQISGNEPPRGFSPHLSWSHYRALMRVQNDDARDFYEREAIECGWSKVQLERQIHSSYYQRIVANQGEPGLIAVDRERLPGELTPATEMFKSPYVLEFLGLPDSPELHEGALEQAIINNLQSFLLELGKGFAFVARQKQIRFDEDIFYIDLVFYNFLLKCFVLVDLKIGKLTHQDVGQMDGYVRLFEDRFKGTGDNPTIGLILCSDKSEAVARYSVLNEGSQIFASKYLQFLPTEDELTREITRERQMVEAAMADVQRASADP